jgi:hypothetical protein
VPCKFDVIPTPRITGWPIESEGGDVASPPAIAFLGPTFEIFGAGSSGVPSRPYIDWEGNRKRSPGEEQFRISPIFEGRNTNDSGTDGLSCWMKIGWPCLAGGDSTKENMIHL